MYLVHRAKKGVTGANFQERPTQRQSCFVFPLLSVGHFVSAFLCPSFPEAGLSATRRRQSVQDKWQKRSFLQLLPGGYLYILAAVAKIPRLVFGRGVL